VLRGGTRALALSSGSLAPGLRADVVVLDGEHPILTGRSGDDLLDSWIFSGNRPAVRDVMVGGRWVVRDGRHLREDQTLAAYRDALRRLG
jgi:formimidoylglutamate deiminase